MSLAFCSSSAFTASVTNFHWLAGLEQAERREAHANLGDHAVDHVAIRVELREQRLKMGTAEAIQLLFFENQLLTPWSGRLHRFPAA